MKRFVHLHTHSEFSALDGLGRVSEIVGEAKRLKMPAVAITDHGSVAGAPEFYKEARAQGILPILGQEFYIVPDASKKDSKANDYTANRHVLILATDVESWHTLVELTSVANDESNFHYKPRIDHRILREYRRRLDGLVVTSSCLTGEVNRALQAGGRVEADKMVKLYKKFFGENFYLELQRHPIQKKYLKSKKDVALEERAFEADQEVLNSYLVGASKRFGVRLLITNDIHFINEEDHDVHDLMLAAQTGSAYYERKRFKFNGTGYWMKSTKEMQTLWADVPKVWEESQKSIEAIVKKASGLRVPEFETTTWHIPKIPGQKRDPVRDLEKRCRKALRRLPLSPRMRKTYDRRLTHELATIRQANFEQIFLIVQDYVNWSRSRGIIVGAGRGSMVGSLVSYLLGITKIDPVKFRLLFERAINPARPSIPDFDIDFENDRIEETIEYVRQKYGEENVMLIGTHQHMAPRQTFKKVFTALRVPFTVANAITQQLPETVEITNNKASGDVRELLDGDIPAELEPLLKEHEIIARAVPKLAGILNSFGTHAAGVIISDERRPLLQEVPRMRIASSGRYSSQFDMDALKKMHLVKFDFLRLSTLKSIAEAVKLIGHDPFEGQENKFDEPEVFKMITEGDLVTIFQFQGGAARRCIQEMGVDNFEDLVAVNALARPGSINFLPDYVRGKRNPKKIRYACPEIEPILGYTYGVIIYQEQVMEIVKELAGWDDLGADRIKEAIKSKSGKEFDEMKPDFIKGCNDNGISVSAAESIWKNIDDYRSYGFNRAHAVAYSSIGYQTAYLKRHYPREWFTAVLNTSYENANYQEIIDEVRRLGIGLLPPHINRSSEIFRLEKKGIRFGLLQIKGIGKASARDLIEEREKRGKFLDLSDFEQRMGPYRSYTKRTREALDKSGALQTLGLATYPATAQQEVLGTWVTNYPLDPYRKQLDKLLWNKKNRRALTSDVDKTPVYWGGLVTRVHPIKTRKGDAMGFIQVSYYGQKEDVTLFPNVWGQYGHTLRRDSVLYLRGERDVERNCIIAQTIKVAPSG